jgi:hypothetical protein
MAVVRMPKTSTPHLETGTPVELSLERVSGRRVDDFARALAFEASDAIERYRSYPTTPKTPPSSSQTPSSPVIYRQRGDIKRL